MHDDRVQPVVKYYYTNNTMLTNCGIKATDYCGKRQRMNGSR